MNEAYREVLPYLRPRSGEMGWLGGLMAGLLLALLVGAVASYVLTLWRARTRTRRAFYAAALERGLTKPQVRLLFELATRRRMRDPLLLLSSLKIFDRYAGHLAAESDHDEKLEALARIRRRLGFDAPPPSQRFYSTRTLALGQRLMVWPHGEVTGFLSCVVADRDEREITVVPLLRRGDQLLSQLQAGEPVKVRFWRDGDTEYRFRTRILQVEPHSTAVHLAHAERLERVQLRDYFRIRVHLPVKLYAMPEGVEQAEAARVLAEGEARQGVLLDLSGGGLGVRVDDPMPRHAEIVVDPHWQGPFPIAGARLLLVDQSHREGAWEARLQFVDLPTAVRDDLVAAVFAHELHSARS